MKRQLSVACVCLTRDRDRMLEQSILSFESQNYGNKTLYVLDNGDGRHSHQLAQRHPHVVRYWLDDSCGCSHNRTIGELRNIVNGYAFGKGPPDIIVHWDDDDWSHPSRIEDQVEILQRTGADVVGYNEVLFAVKFGTTEAIEVTRSGIFDGPNDPPPSQYREYVPGVTRYSYQAYHYCDRRKTYAIGSSLCYWTKTWQRRPFQKAPIRPNATGEDSLFIEGLNCVGVSGLTDPAGPRMVCRVHGSNSADYSNLTREGAARGTSFTRAEAFDRYCAEVFRGE